MENSRIAVLTKLANDRPELRAKLVPLIKEARLPANVYIGYDRGAIWFNFDYPLPPMDWYTTIQSYANDAIALQKKTVDALERVFGGNKKISSKMYYNVRDEDHRLVLLGPAAIAAGVFEVDVPGKIKELGKGFLPTLTGIFTKIGWDVKHVEDAADQRP